MTATAVQTIMMLITPRLSDFLSDLSSSKSLRVKIKEAETFTGIKFKRAQDLVDLLVEMAPHLEDEDQADILTCIGFLIEEIEEEKMALKRTIQRSRR